MIRPWRTRSGPLFPWACPPSVLRNTWIWTGLIRIRRIDLDLTAYRQEYLRLRDKYRDRLDIFYGVELGLQPHLGDRLKAFAAAHPEFDFILGSTHVSRQMDPYYPIFFEGRTEEEAYLTYFTDSLLSLRAFHQIDSYGHMDYVVRYGPHQDRFYSYERYQDVIDPILDLLLAHDIALEINTAGFSKGLSYYTFEGRQAVPHRIL